MRLSISPIGGECSSRQTAAQKKRLENPFFFQQSTTNCLSLVLVYLHTYTILLKLGENTKILARERDRVHGRVPFHLRHRVSRVKVMPSHQSLDDRSQHSLVDGTVFLLAEHIPRVTRRFLIAIRHCAQTGVVSLPDERALDRVDRPDHFSKLVAVQNTVAVRVRPRVELLGSLHDDSSIVGNRPPRSSSINAASLPPRRAEATQHIGRDGKTAEYRRETSERRLGDEHLFWVT